MSEQATPNRALKWVFNVLMVGGIIFVAASLYTDFTSEVDPAWTNFSAPTIFGVLGARSLLLPDPTRDAKNQRVVGILILTLSALLFILALTDL